MTMRSRLNRLSALAPPPAPCPECEQRDGHARAGLARLTDEELHQLEQLYRKMYPQYPKTEPEPKR